MRTKPKETRSEVEIMCRGNGSMAVDQRADYGSLAEALSAYFDNVGDTLIEMGLSPQATHRSYEWFMAGATKEALAQGIELPESW